MSRGPVGQPLSCGKEIILRKQNPSDAETRDYYAILGVRRIATQAEIVKAYRQLAKEVHPDRQGQFAKDDERFKRIVKAYSILSDPQKRRCYDLGGKTGLRLYNYYTQSDFHRGEIAGGKWRWPWNRPDPMKLPSIADSFEAARMYPLYLELVDAVKNNYLDDALFDALQRNGYGIVANAVENALRHSFQCQFCKNHIEEGLEGICYCYDYSGESTHHRNRCCPKYKPPKSFLSKIRNYFSSSPSNSNEHNVRLNSEISD